MKFLVLTRWFAGLRPASLLGLRLPNKLGVFATDTVGHLKFPEKNKVDKKSEVILYTKK